MKITHQKLLSEHGVNLSIGKYAIRAKDGFYEIYTVKDDTEGCIIVGSINERTDDDWVGGSKIAMQRLLPKIEDAIAVGHKVTLVVV